MAHTFMYNSMNYYMIILHVEHIFYVLHIQDLQDRHHIYH